MPQKKVFRIAKFDRPIIMSFNVLLLGLSRSHNDFYLWGAYDLMSSMYDCICLLKCSSNLCVTRRWNTSIENTPYNFPVQRHDAFQFCRELVHKSTMFLSRILCSRHGEICGYLMIEMMLSTAHGLVVSGNSYQQPHDNSGKRNETRPSFR